MGILKIDYLIKNGEACARFLENGARIAENPQLRNELYNHGLAVAALIKELREYEAKNKENEKRIAFLERKVYLFERGEVDPIIAEQFENLKRHFKSLICDYIDSF